MVGYSKAFGTVDSENFHHQTASPKVLKTSATVNGLLSIQLISVHVIQQPTSRSYSWQPQSSTEDLLYLRSVLQTSD